jgi:transcriptional antiterminator RfaH
LHDAPQLSSLNQQSLKNIGALAATPFNQWSLNMSTEVVAQHPQWYVVHTNPKQEDRADSNLRVWGVETLHPKFKTRRVNEFTGVPSYITKPLFPRYIFARFDARKQFAKISFTRGVHHVVSFGGQPTPVEEEIIQIISARIDPNGFVEVGDKLKQGDKVVIKGGPLRDFEGVFERELNDNERISVLLTTISYQGRVVVKRELLERASG